MNIRKMIPVLLIPLTLIACSKDNSKSDADEFCLALTGKRLADGYYTQPGQNITDYVLCMESFKD